MSRHHVLGLYRRLLRQAKMSPLDRRERMVSRVRSEFRENAGEEDPARSRPHSLPVPRPERPQG